MADKRHHIADAPHAMAAVGHGPYLNREFITHGDRWTFGRRSNSASR